MTEIESRIKRIERLERIMELEEPFISWAQNNLDLLEHPQYLELTALLDAIRHGEINAD